LVFLVGVAEWVLFCGDDWRLFLLRLILWVRFVENFGVFVMLVGLIWFGNLEFLKLKSSWSVGCLLFLDDAFLNYVDGVWWLKFVMDYRFRWLLDWSGFMVTEWLLIHDENGLMVVGWLCKIVVLLGSWHWWYSLGSCCEISGLRILLTILMDMYFNVKNLC
jgi:hypothetical protein